MAVAAMLLTTAEWADVFFFEGIARHDNITVEFA